MQVQVNSGEIHVTQSISEMVSAEVESALGMFRERITRVVVHLHDLNGREKAGMDKRCVMEARPAGLDPIAVNFTGASFGEAITGAAGKLGRAVKHKLERVSDRPGAEHPHET